MWLALIAGVAALWPATWGGFTGLTVVHGASMQPTYQTSDLVFTLRQPTYEVGDIVSYEVPAGQPGAGGRVIHRIVSFADEQPVVFTTKGDNNPEADAWLITSEDIFGKAVLQLPGIGAGLTSRNYALLIGAVAGFVVLVLLWPSSRRGANPQGKFADTTGEDAQ